MSQQFIDLLCSETPELFYEFHLEKAPTNLALTRLLRKMHPSLYKGGGDLIVRPKERTTVEEISKQVKSFCPFATTCPTISFLRCAECFRYFVKSSIIGLEAQLHA